jgi:hypothetical protein
MTDPVRLLESGELSSFARELLESARQDQPGAASSSILLAGLDLGQTYPLSLPSTPPDSGVHLRFPGPEAEAGSSGAAGGGGASSGVGMALGKGSALLWGGAGLGVLGAALAAFLALGPVDAPSSNLAECPAGAVCPPNARPTEPTPKQGPTLSEDPASSVHRPVASTGELAPSIEPSLAKGRGYPARPSTSSSKPPAPLSLKDEVVALEPARVALRSGNPRAALLVLSRYSARFPKGALAPEAEAMRAQARILLTSSSKQ